MLLFRERKRGQTYHESNPVYITELPLLYCHDPLSTGRACVITHWEQDIKWLCMLLYFEDSLHFKDKCFVCRQQISKPGVSLVWHDLMKCFESRADREHCVYCVCMFIRPCMWADSEDYRNTHGDSTNVKEDIFSSYQFSAFCAQT